MPLLLLALLLLPCEPLCVDLCADVLRCVAGALLAAVTARGSWDATVDDAAHAADSEDSDAAAIMASSVAAATACW